MLSFLGGVYREIICLYFIYTASYCLPKVDGGQFSRDIAKCHRIEILVPDSFYKDSHRKIFQAITRLFTENKSVDLLTLTDRLTKDGQIEDVGGASYLAYLTTVVPTAANLVHYAKIVKEKYILRQLIQNATQVVSDCFDATQDVEALLDRSEKLIFDITSKKFSVGAVPLKEIIRNQIETIDRL